MTRKALQFTFQVRTIDGRGADELRRVQAEAVLQVLKAIADPAKQADGEPAHRLEKGE